VLQCTSTRALERRIRRGSRRDALVRCFHGIPNIYPPPNHLQGKEWGPAPPTAKLESNVWSSWRADRRDPSCCCRSRGHEGEGIASPTLSSSARSAEAHWARTLVVSPNSRMVRGPSARAQGSGCWARTLSFSGYLTMNIVGGMVLVDMVWDEGVEIYPPAQRRAIRHGVIRSTAPGDCILLLTPRGWEAGPSRKQSIVVITTRSSRPVHHVHSSSPRWEVLLGIQRGGDLPFSCPLWRCHAPPQWA
jgi:hypothetical protein